jgi:type IV fimbrial biogenesis protein FimT
MLAVTSMRRCARRAVGVTLPELCIVLAVSAIVLAIAVPDLRDLVRAQQLKAATGDLFAAIDLARAQALARGRQVKVVPRDPLGADWRQGWQVLGDGGSDGRPGTDELIAQHGPLAPGIAVDFAFTNVARPYYIAYNGAGRSCADGNSAAARWGTVSLFHGGHIRRIKINMLGRARVCDPARDAGCDGAPAP